MLKENSHPKILYKKAILKCKGELNTFSQKLKNMFLADNIQGMFFNIILY